MNSSDARLIVSRDGVILHEYPVTAERISIGRHAENTIRIDDPAVSSRHAIIRVLANAERDAVLEDLESTNGTLVNGKEVTRHLLRHNDVIGIGRHELRYLNPGLAGASGIEKTMVIRTRAAQPPRAPGPPAAPSAPPGPKPPAATPAPPPPAPAATPAPPPPPAAGGRQGAARPAREAGGPEAARLRVLTGPQVGREIDLTRPLTPIGQEGGERAVIRRGPEGYVLSSLWSNRPPRINGQPMKAGGAVLADGDVIELAGLKLEILLP